MALFSAEAEFSLATAFDGQSGTGPSGSVNLICSDSIKVPQTLVLPASTAQSTTLSTTQTQKTNSDDSESANVDSTTANTNVDFTNFDSNSNPIANPMDNIHNDSNIGVIVGVVVGCVVICTALMLMVVFFLKRSNSSSIEKETAVSEIRFEPLAAERQSTTMLDAKAGKHQYTTPKK